jgi:CRISPR-associated protein (TIGR03986 family)
VKTVVILSWDPDSRTLEYVDVNGGMGGVAERFAVSEDSAEGISDQLRGHDLPRTADFEAEGDFVLVDGVSRARVMRCRVKAVGRPDDKRFELTDRQRRVPVAAVPVAGLGVTDTALADAANTLEYLYAEHLSPPGCWLGCEGGIGTWLAGRRQALGQAEARRRDAARRAEADKRFVNPYTFVPFPEVIARGKPGGHHWLAPERLSGAFTVTWEFTTPFQAPEGAAGTTVLRLPGASVKGAVRSVHEALAGGCLRVFDAEFIPSYRDHANVRGREWTLAVVDKATGDGQPLTVSLCDEVVWVGAGQLRQACGGSLATGSRVGIKAADVPAKPNSLGRKELPSSAVVAGKGDWVVLVTDSGTRQPKKKTYFLACGRLGARSAEVSEAAWRTFRSAVADARDMQPGVRQREGRDADVPQPTSLVRFDGQPIGRRRVVTGRLWEGDVIWVRLRDDGASRTVAELSLAALWRHASQGPAGRRVPPDLLGCRDPNSLCPTCRVFGSADPETRERDAGARQRSYAGHVRFGDAYTERPVELKPVQRAPLGVPRPGAGQFYLAYADPSPASGRDHKPTREWGSDPDAERPRPLRGRKFYWHADPAAQQPRHEARDHQRTRPDQTESELVTTRYLAPAGTTLRQQVTFDNLSRAEFGGLLAAFDPRQVLAGLVPKGRRLLVHLGGGKPLGLGSCAATVGGLRVWTAASRYGGAPEATPDPEGYLREFAEGCPAETRENTWPALAAVLAEGTVDPARVWYPPGAHWPDRQDDQEEFDKPFAFFTASSGMFIEPPGRQRQLIPLPDPASGDQSLPIVRKQDLQ